MANEERLKKLSGKRYVCMPRCSGDTQVDTSIPGQLDDLHRIGKTYGGIHAGKDIILDAVSGSKPGNRTDIMEAIKRKHEDNDFDVILTLVEDRFTRSGSGHGMWAEYELMRNGIEVVHVNSDVPDGPFAPYLRVMKYEAARETAKSIGTRTAAEIQRKIEAGKISTASKTPYGCYRLYLNDNKEPLFIIRDNRDGTQTKLHHQTREELGTFGHVGGKTDRFKKQKSDRSFIVPGNSVEVETVQLIWTRRWLEGVGGLRTAKELNAKGIPAPYGGKWTQRQVDVIAENPIYCGIGIAGIKGGSRFVRRAKGGPKPVEVDPFILANKKTLPVSWYPIEDRTEREEPHLKDFLPERLREIALPKVRELLNRRALGDVEPWTSHAHLDSRYLLTGLIRPLQGDGKRFLVGQNCGPKGHMTRYYAHPIARKDPEAAGFPNTTFRADVLENALLKVLGEILLSAEDLQQEVRAAVEAEIAAREKVIPPDVEALTKELANVRAKIRATFSLVTPETKDEAQPVLASLGQKRRHLEAQIEQATRPSGDEPDVDAIVESIVDRLRDLGGQMGMLPTHHLRQVLATITESITADMHTREVQMMLRVPRSAILDVEKGISDLCLLANSGSSTGCQAQNANHVLATIHCVHERLAGKQCYTCRRKAA